MVEIGELSRQLHGSSTNSRSVGLNESREIKTWADESRSVPSSFNLLALQSTAGGGSDDCGLVWTTVLQYLKVLRGQ